ncbi:MAG: AAA family ATPase [Desulfobacula sp.]|nr:AAA family ATPase [Desulfobacula sp.]
MYTEFYGFKEKPFNLVPNPSYLFLSSKHANALTFLEYGLTENIGFVMLTGEIGIGKTTLIRFILNQIESEMDVAVIFNTNIYSDELIKMILNEFEISYEDGISKAKALDILYEFLIEKYSLGRKVLLIIDEAQNLSDEVLEEIRMLSNIQTDEEMLLQIMIVGQPELRDKINDPRLEQFAQRIAVSYHLSAMTSKETGDYILHRLEKAGGNKKLFTTEAIEKIYEVSTGIPRTINLLCDAALVYGFADEKKEINLAFIDQVIEDKGGMGVFTRARLKQNSGKPDSSASVNQDSGNDLIERITNVEETFSQLKKLYHNYIKEVESRAEFCRNKMVFELKTALVNERKRNEKLAMKYGGIKERYNLLLKRIKK